MDRIIKIMKIKLVYIWLISRLFINKNYVVLDFGFVIVNVYRGLFIGFVRNIIMVYFCIIGYVLFYVGR